MNIRALAVLALSSSLSGCFLWSSDPGPKPSPLPVFKPVGEVRELWKVSLSEAGDALLSPAFSGGSVYAAGRNGILSRIDAAGRELWRVKTAPRLSGGVASDNNVVVVASSDGELLAYEADKGSLRWKVPVGGEILSTPLIADDLVIVRIGDSQLAAYGSADGKRRWLYQRAQSTLSLRSHGGLARSGDMIIAGFPGGKLLALSLAGGIQRWEATIAQPKGSNEIERMADVVGEPLVLGDQICVAAFQGRVACVERASGNLRWARDFSSASGVSADADTLYFADHADTVYALDLSTGASKWKQDKLARRQLARPLALGSSVVLADAQGYAHVLGSKNGEFLANMRIDSSGVRAPLIALPNEGFAAQALDGDVHALTLRK